MSHSARFNKLKSRVQFIESNILPLAKISGDYSKKESDLIRAYVLLVHAEIEAYFEDVAQAKAQKVVADWKLNRTKSNCLLSIVTFMGGDLKWENKSEQDKVETRISKTVAHYIGILKKNHGIKAKNIRNILLPLGIEEHQLDPAWLGTMDSFGATRGKIAHSTISVQSQIDLVSERNNINNAIIPEIVLLDLLIKKLK